MLCALGGYLVGLRSLAGRWQNGDVRGSIVSRTSSAVIVSTPRRGRCMVSVTGGDCGVGPVFSVCICRRLVRSVGRRG